MTHVAFQMNRRAERIEILRSNIARVERQIADVGGRGGDTRLLQFLMRDFQARLATLTGELKSAPNSRRSWSMRMENE